MQLIVSKQAVVWGNNADLVILEIELVSTLYTDAFYAYDVAQNNRQI